MSAPRVAFAGDRDIAVKIFKYLTERDVDLPVLILPDSDKASHDQELLSIYRQHRTESAILRGDKFRTKDGVTTLQEADLDYILSAHFQHIFPQKVLDIPEYEVINIHPAYLPYNRGWHTPSWAIWDQTPYGATIHVMEEEIDAGDIIARQRVEIQPSDTANSLYNKVKKAELQLFKDTWPQLASFDYTTQEQSEQKATVHRKSDLEDIRRIEFEGRLSSEKLIRKLRALTTNDITEAAYFEKDGKKYRVQVDISPVEENKQKE